MKLIKKLLLLPFITPFVVSCTAPTTQQSTTTQPEQEPFAYVYIENSYSLVPNENEGYDKELTSYKCDFWARDIFDDKWRLYDTFWIDVYVYDKEKYLREQIILILEHRFKIDKNDLKQLKEIFKNIKYIYNNN